MKKFMIVQDNDCHWYVIPTECEGKWEKFLNSEEYEDGVIPKFAESVGGNPRLVKFQNYIIE